MALKIKRWQDMGAQVKAYVSTSGDFVSLGTRTEYPFVAGGPNGAPKDWSVFVASGGAISEVNLSTDTATGRFSISNADAVAHVNREYGIYRTFPMRDNYKYLISLRCQTMQDKAAATRYVALSMVNGTINVWGIVDLSQPSWERILPWTYIETGRQNFTIKLSAMANPLVEDATWGIQYDSFAVTEQAATYPAPVWEEITCDARSLNSRYGRERFTSRYEVGGCQLSLLNDDGQFTYDPNGTLRPGRFIKLTLIRPNEAPVEQPMFYGILDSLTDAYTLDGHAVTVMSAFDVSSLLSNTQVPTVAPWGRNSGDRIGFLYTAVGWYEPMQVSETGQFLQQGVYANGRTIRDEIGLCADSEGGYWFADRTGVLRYFDRTWPTRALTQTSVQANILAMPEPSELPIVDNYPTALDAPWVCAHALDTNWGKDRVVNEVELANAGGVSRLYIDSESQRMYGPHTYSRLDFVNDNTHPEYLDTRANDFMSGFTEAILRVNSVEFRPQLDSIPFATNVFLNDVVRVWYVHPSNLWAYAVVTHVQSVEHRITVDDWTVSLALDQPISLTRFEWDPDMGANGWDYAEWDVNVWDQGPEQVGAIWTHGDNWDAVPSIWGKDSNINGSQWNTGRRWDGPTQWGE